MWLLKYVLCILLNLQISRVIVLVLSSSFSGNVMFFREKKFHCIVENEFDSFDIISNYTVQAGSSEGC